MSENQLVRRPNEWICAVSESYLHNSLQGQGRCWSCSGFLMRSCWKNLFYPNPSSTRSITGDPARPRKPQNSRGMWSVRNGNDFLARWKSWLFPHLSREVNSSSEPLQGEINSWRWYQTSQNSSWKNHPEFCVVVRCSN